MDKTNHNNTSAIPENNREFSWEDYFANFGCNRSSIASKLKGFEYLCTDDKVSIDNENQRNQSITYLKSVILKPGKKALAFKAFKEVLSDDSALTSATFNMILSHLSNLTLDRIIKKYYEFDEKHNVNKVKSKIGLEALQTLNNELRESRNEKMFQLENNLDKTENLPSLDYYDNRRYDDKKAVPGYMKINNSHLQQ